MPFAVHRNHTAAHRASGARLRRGPGLTALRGLLLAAALLAATGSSAADAGHAGGQQRAFDRLFEQTLAHYPLPGLAVGVVEDGKVVYRRTAGELRAGSGERIDADTLFKIASNSKAMTTGVLARLVDQGKLAWDDPVSKYLPDFRMYDPWVTRNIQVRDLLIHNSGLGLGAGDLMLWPEPNDFSRDDIIAGLAHLKPTHSFRAHYAYDNLMYVVAGKVAERAGGMPYAQMVREQLFEPLGMQRCQVGGWSRDAVGNVAQPHMLQDGRNVVVRADPAQIPDSASMAAGGIRCSLDDMLAWIERAWLAPDPAKPWLSDAQRRAVWSIQTPMPISQRLRDWDDTHVYGYGYGWRISDVDGQWRVAHTGTLMGMYSSVVLLPSRGVGIVILINGDGGRAREALGEALTKHYTRADAGLDVDHYAALLDALSPGAHADAMPETSARVPATAQQLRGELGRYRDPWFGEVQLCAADGGVRLRSLKSPLLQGRVMRVGTRWLVDWDDASVDSEPWLAFSSAGHGVRMTLAPVDPHADFSYDYHDLDFSRVGPCAAVAAASDRN